MIKFLKISTIILLALLSIATLLVLLSFQSLVSIVAVPTAILAAYYLVLLYLISILKKLESNRLLSAVVWILFLVPILWCLVSPEGLFELLTPNLHLDMK